MLVRFIGFRKTASPDCWHVTRGERVQCPHTTVASQGQKHGYQLDTLGGVRVADILRWHGNIQGFQVTQEDIASAVAEEYISSQYRKRQLSMYADEEEHLRVRAYQGHS